MREQPRVENHRLRLHSRHGFTLVEALLAAVLIVIGIAGALGAISAGLRAGAAGDFYRVSALLAQQKMAELEAAPQLSVGEEEGDFEPDYTGYDWSYTIEEGPEGLWLVRLKISETTDAERSREAEIVTYLLRRG
ncbi:MAG: hypothetical protein GTO55_05055 [Armatimonadetes bacterium]|nr:hypothetical protein [Armatimonadota bacterium]NIM23635.1 hypothetical protein [Armatimonadota bacterium]NIM67502.1 hypothetical protein [Armatimonadota bacterium]NIM75998.1 hypothetical protein [Armatimonadota bacterium]NIN05687.1 hypothetical protein [Armatimonadota bacterium]